MIPLGSDSTPRLVIGHNVGYDRVRLGEEYRLERTGTRYLDTMALHIAVAGMTSQQVPSLTTSLTRLIRLTRLTVQLFFTETGLELLQESQ